jgi:hypothetical protein
VEEQGTGNREQVSGFVSCACSKTTRRKSMRGNGQTLPATVSGLDTAKDQA